MNAKRRELHYDSRQKTFDAMSTLSFSDIKKLHDEELKDKAYTYCILASGKRVKKDDLKNVVT